MRALAIVMALASAAHADSKQEVDKLVRARIAMRPGDAAVDTDTLVYVNGRAVTANIPAEVWDMRMPSPEDFTYDIKVDTLEVVEAGKGVAWFHGKAKYTVAAGEGANETITRFDGIALVKAKAWKIAALSFTYAFFDAKMIADAKAHKPPVTAPASPSLDGDAAIAKTVAAWFSGGALAKSAVASKHIANGTTAGEYASDAGATKLATGWDALKLAPIKVTAKPFGDIAIVVAKVAMPIPKATATAPMIATVIVFKEGGAWHWVSLNWAARDVLDPPKPVGTK